MSAFSILSGIFITSNLLFKYLIKLIKAFSLNELFALLIKLFKLSFNIGYLDFSIYSWLSIFLLQNKYGKIKESQASSCILFLFCCISFSDGLKLLNSFLFLIFF